MTNDAINWKTVKIPEAVRDDAQEDQRTYGEIMRAGLEAPCPENDADINRDLLAEQVIDTLDPRLREIEAAAKEATQTAQETQHTIEGLQ